MPRSSAAHLRSVIGDEHTVESVTVEDRQDSQHIDIAIVNKCLPIMRNLAMNIAEMDIGNAVLPAVLIDSAVEVAVAHFSKCPKTELEAVAGTGVDIDQLLIHIVLINEPRLLSHRRQRKIVGMSGQRYPGLFRDGKNFFEEPLQS